MSSWDLTACVDLHLHSAPDVRPRKLDDIDLARAAKVAGYKAILLKSHHTITADRAQMAEKAVGGGVRVFGGIALNWPVGGLNPDAVEAAAKLGARKVWFPTLSASTEQRDPQGENRSRRGFVRVLDGDGKLLREAHEILELIRRHGLILGTGHLSAEEIFPLVEAAREMGIRKIVITHPEHPLINMTVERQRDLAAIGVVFERCFCFAAGALPHLMPVTLRQICGAIKEVGVESTILATDLGRADLPDPIEGLATYLRGLHNEGLGWEDLRRMCSEAPAQLLGI